ncbi:MAG: FliA/WhiG family RNA polymerase sigma factor [Calditrichaeota bacterium]|nr:MAG: FliA/WhiG family RNA polymerase sigma factor [Calditrichota bacterium]
MKATVDPLWKKYYECKTDELRQRLMVKYLGLVHYVVNKLFKSIPQNIERNDLVNIGVLGLSEALDRYNPYFGIKFETYAIPRIKGAIIDELRKQDWMPRSLRSKSNLIKKAIDELEQTTRGEVSDQEVANYLGISEKEYLTWQSQLNRTNVVSLDKPNPNYDDHNLYEAIEDPAGENPMENMENEEMKALLVKIIKQLPEKARMAITLYYYERLTFKEIGKILNVSESRISQIHSETIERMRKMLTKELYV